MAHDEQLWQPATIPDNLEPIAGLLRREPATAEAIRVAWELLSRTNLRISRALKILSKFRVVMDADKPTACGCGVLWVDTATDTLYYDDPAADPYAWVSLGGGGGSTIELVTTGFDKNLSAADDTVQKALDTIDDLDLGGTTGSIKLTVYNSHVAQLITGTVCYVSGSVAGNPAVLKAKADAEATAIGMLVMANETIDPDSTGEAMVLGSVSGFDSKIAGQLQYLSPTGAGNITSTVPTGSGQFVRIVGHAISSGVVYFNPDKTYLELA